MGGLKNIYESGHATHIVITVNKEFIWNEKRGWVSCSTTLYRARYPTPISPSDHPTLERFVAAVEAAWRIAWVRAYALRDAHESRRGGDREMV